MADRIPFTYGEFYDVPRMIRFQFGEDWFFLRSYFDDESDGYREFYEVFLLPYRSEEEIKANPDYWMDMSNAVHLGQIPIAEIGIDPTLRRTIDAVAFDKWVSARKQLHATNP